MSFDYENEQTNSILAEADIIVVDIPRLAPEILGAVTSSMEDAGGTEWMALQEGSGGELWRGEGLCQGPPPSILDAHRVLTCTNT